MPFGGNYFGAGYFGSEFFGKGGEAPSFMPAFLLRTARDTCVTERLCKRAADVDRRGWDLTWLCIRSWSPATYFPQGTFIRPMSLHMGGENGFNGYDYEATQGGFSAETEPTFPTGEDGTAEDGSVIWTRRAPSDSSLYRSIASLDDVVWSTDNGLAVGEANVIIANGIVQISAVHTAGQPGKDARSFALVTFTDGTVGEFVFRWKLTP